MPSSLTQKFPATNGIRWFNVVVFTITTLIAVYGLLTVKLRHDTFFFSVAYYIYSMLGEKHIFLITSRVGFTDTHNASPFTGITAGELPLNHMCEPGKIRILNDYT